MIDGVRLIAEDAILSKTSTDIMEMPAPESANAIPMPAVVARRAAEMVRQADEAARAEAEAVRLQEADKLAEERRRAVLSRLRSGGTSVKWGEIS